MRGQYREGNIGFFPIAGKVSAGKCYIIPAGVKGPETLFW